MSKPKLIDIVRALDRLQLCPFDGYFRTMAEADILNGRGMEPAVKAFFIRKAPFGGSYALLGGITKVIRVLTDMRFDTERFQQHGKKHGYHPALLDYLKKHGQFKIQIETVPEGSVFFPNEPVIVARGPLPFVRLIEGIVTELCNHGSLILSKCDRVLSVTRPGHVLEFARRRSQNAADSSLYGLLAGCFATSNADLEEACDLTAEGTMGHEGPQSRETVEHYYDEWLEVRPDKPVAIIDTKRCMEHDFPAWLAAVWKHREAIKVANPKVWGWRNDSGDLVYLTVEQYFRVRKHPLWEDPWFNERLRIFLTNEIDEHAAASIIGQIRTEAGAAGLDAEDILRRIVWGVGTKAGTCSDEPALGGVMKLAEVNNKPVIKLALDAEGKVGPKTSLPGFNRSAFIFSNDDDFQAVLIYPARRYKIVDGKLYDVDRRATIEELPAFHPDTPGLVKVYTNYRLVPRQQLVFDSIVGDGVTDLWQNDTIEDVARRSMAEVDQLPRFLTRLDNPHLAQVSVTEDIFNLRRHMIEGGRLMDEYMAL